MTDQSLNIHDNVLFIRAGDGFIPKGIRMEGYRVEKPYHEGGLLLRILREVWFRAKLPFKEIWYNKHVLNFSGEHVIVYDPQITADYLRWLQKQNRWNIIFFYGNMVGRARHIRPDQIPEGIAGWTYERHDSVAYGLSLNTRMSYYSSYCQEKQPTEYDVLFVGRDKGRMDFLVQLENALNKAGMKTFFRVIGDTRFEKRKDKRYGAEMDYEEICALIAKSRAILNVTLPGQEGITIRDFEAICNNVKLITTNPKIVERDFFKESNILVIDHVDANQIRQFLDAPFEPYSMEVRQSLSVDKWINEMTEDRTK